MKDAWYSDGLRFGCLEGCVDCCVTHGDHAYVYLEDHDLGRLARHLGISRKLLRERYTREDEGHVVLSMDRPECPFLGEAGCTVYEARPLQCRTFPFWEENLASRSDWNRTAGFCPGIGRGPVHSRERIEDQVRSRKAVAEDRWNRS